MPPSHIAFAPATLPQSARASTAAPPESSLGRGIAFGLVLAIPMWAAIVTALLLVLT